MVNRHRHNRDRAQVTKFLPFKVALHKGQWLTIEDDFFRHAYLVEDIAFDIASNPLFTGYVIDFASMDGSVQQYYWPTIQFIESKSIMLAADYMYASPNAEFRSGANYNYSIYEDWSYADLGVDYMVFISFNTEQEAMLFKLMYG